MENNRVKFYKNPARNEVEAHTPYVPRYQVIGVSPSIRNDNVNNLQHIKRTPPPAPSIVSRPYAEYIESPIGRGRGEIPNVGNNFEQTWQSVDGKITDDLSIEIDNNHEMIDNNEFINEPANSISAPYNSSHENNSIIKTIHSLKNDDYLLLVDGVPLCSGLPEYIQEQASLLVFGEHPAYNGSVHVNNILIIKKINILVGVYLK